MDKAEYWLLNAVVDRWCALEWLLAGPPEARVERPAAGLTYGKLVDTLRRLFQQKDLVAQHMVLHPQQVVGDDFVPTLAQLEAALAGEEHLAYRLTTRGGKRWEEYTRPDWNQFIDCRVESEGKITGYDRSRVQQYLARLHRQHQGAVIAGSEQWDTLVPWEPTYWKVLPMAHRVRFRSALPDLPGAQQEPGLSLAGGKTWLSLALSRWRKKRAS